jgi:2,3-bisphosphoglycerate-dependent phosphoglycerate mutase
MRLSLALSAILGSVSALCACAREPVTEEPLLRLYVARHGQTDWNLAKRLQGGTDIPLNDTGKAHAQKLVQTLDGLPLDAIYSSALARSKETAAALGARMAATALPELNEQRMGKFEGAYVDGRDPALEAEYHKRTSDLEDTLDGGESVSQHFARVRGAVERIRAEHPRGNVLIVGHGGTNALVLRAILGLTPEQTDTIHQANDEIYVIDLPAGKPPRLWKHIPLDKLGEL